MGFGSKPRADIAKVAQYLKAEVSRAVRGPVTGDALAARVNACKACPHRKDALGNATDPGGIGFCDACGCGGRRRAALSIKATMPAATCPQGKWEPAPTQEQTQPASPMRPSYAPMPISEQVKLLQRPRDTRSGDR